MCGKKGICKQWFVKWEGLVGRVALWREGERESGGEICSTHTHILEYKFIHFLLKGGKGQGVHLRAAFLV